MTCRRHSGPRSGIRNPYFWQGLDSALIARKPRGMTAVRYATTAGAGFAAAISLISLVTAMLSILPVPSIGSFSM